MNRDSIIKQCREAGACKEELARLVKAETDEEFNQILADNIDWVVRNYIEADFNQIFLLRGLNGRNWCWFLRDHPRFAKYCDWSKLNGENWCWLLRTRPQFAKFCDWRKLNDDDWYWLLKKRPQFILHREGV